MDKEPVASTSTSTCIVCGEQFTYPLKLRLCGRNGKSKQYAFRKVCDGCRQTLRRKVNKEWKKKHGLAERGGHHEFHYTKDSSLVKASHAEVARSLNMKVVDVIALEREVLRKIRNNPELQELWGNFKEDGLPLPEDLFQASDQGRVLLDYQLAVVDWWAVHDRISEVGDTGGAMECLSEIQKFQHTIVDTLESL